MPCRCCKPFPDTTTQLTSRPVVFLLRCSPQRARLCLQDRLLRCGGAAAPSSSLGGGARWLVFCCNSAADVQRAAGIMAGVAAAARAKRRGGVPAGSLSPEVRPL